MTQCRKCQEYCCSSCIMTCEQCDKMYCKNHVYDHDCLTKKSIQQHIEEKKVIPQQPTITEGEKELECCICLDTMDCLSFVIVPCGHTKFHESCVKLLKNCPICRTEIKEIMKIFSQ